MPVQNFKTALDYTLPLEGSTFTNDEDDHGGPTKYGITLEDLQRWHLDNHLPKATIDDVRNISMETVEAIYEIYYWKALHLDEVLDQRTATAMFDVGVNTGIGHSARFAQRATGLTGAAVDGSIGPDSLSAINKLEGRAFIAAFVPQVQAYYITDVLNDGTQIKFLRGWLSRSQKLITLMI